MDGVKQRLDLVNDPLDLGRDLFAVVAADEAAVALGQVAGTELEADGHAAHLVLSALPAHGLVAVVQLDADIGGDEVRHHTLGGLEHLGILMRGDGHDDDLRGRDARGQDKAVVVAVGHDDRADHARGGAPGRLKRVLELVVAAGEGHVIGAGELISKVVARRTLKRLAVLHHALDGIGRLGARELLLLGLAAGDDGDGEHVAEEVSVAVELLHRLSLRLLGGLVDGVALLPPELARTQERAGGLLPADDGAPLVVLMYDPCPESSFAGHDAYALPAHPPENRMIYSCRQRLHKPN